jgi:sensor domain CHASE-containing protein
VNIRPKLLLLFAAVFAVLGTMEILIQDGVLMPRFAELDRAAAQTSMKRIRSALDMSLDALQVTASDWGNWVDVYRFVQNHDPAFVDANITAVAFKQLKVNAISIVDQGGRVLLNASRDLDSGQPDDLDLMAGTTMPETHPWRGHLRDGKPAGGLVRTNRGIMMIAAAPVLDGTGTGPSLGMVIMGTLLTPAQLRLMGTQAQANVTMSAGHFESDRDVVAETDAATVVRHSFDDIYGRPLLTLNVEVPRAITARGRAALMTAGACAICAAVIVLAILYVFLNRLVLAPIARMTRHAVAVGEGRDLTARLDLPGSDELAQLAREFDRMVARVDDSRRQLVDQSFHAGFAELAKGVLHNLGNAMTPLGVRLQALEDRLRMIPAHDLELAAGALAAEPAHSERRADLEEFLRLGSREVAATVADARADVALMQRQTTLIQGVLAEQMRSTYNEHVVEPVRLPELVAQSLEIVPDACRQRLRVDEDESLRKVGVIRVARTVLRLILQNLIINAADAVRASGKEKGVLRVAAKIVRSDDREQLHLCCEDDGVGIAADHLERVFEKGFSTKSPETNHGIGLHWCANAIGSLGGRIWAASDGPGLGASLHVVLPLAASQSGKMT